VGQLVAAVVGIAILNFGLVHLAPGDPVRMIAGEAGVADATSIRQTREEFGLDRPLPVQLATYVGRTLTGDLGQSFRQRRPVSALILERLPATLLLTSFSLVLAVVLGCSLGTLAALRHGAWVDRLVSMLALLFYATPTFWVALILVLVFSVWLAWLPAYGASSIQPIATFSGRLLDALAHAVLPVVSLGLYYAATYARLTRTAVLGVAHSDFVRTATAKGLPGWRIVLAHILRNAALPVITLVGLQLGQLISGSVVVETIFAWPGIGRLAFEALTQRDYPVLLGVFFVTSILVIAANLLTDLAYGVIDPRVLVKTA
jgi:peptide/nickel transport system permease protein